jgi:hypothetical protein
VKVHMPTLVVAVVANIVAMLLIDYWKGRK